MPRNFPCRPNLSLPGLESDITLRDMTKFFVEWFEFEENENSSYDDLRGAVNCGNNTGDLYYG